MVNNREFADVHDRHCCKRHGCKYGDPDCTVMSGQYQGIICEDCEDDPWIEIHDIHWANLYLNWGWRGFGFGELSFKKNQDGTWSFDDECMDKERCRKILYAFVDKMLDEAKP